MARELQANKDVVCRFNRECLEGGKTALLAEILHPDFVNRTAPPGVDPGAEGMRLVIEEVLHRGLSGIKVLIDDQVAEGDRVSSRKRILGRHTGPFLGVEATGREVTISVFDIVRLKDGRYLEHWGLNTIPLVAQSLRAPVADP